MSTLVRTKIDERVSRGAAYLDEHGPGGWRDRVDLERLDIGDGCDCVLGQLYGSWSEAVMELRLGGQSVGLGFSQGFLDYADKLTEAWRRELA